MQLDLTLEDRVRVIQALRLHRKTLCNKLVGDGGECDEFLERELAAIDNLLERMKVWED